MTSLRRSCLVEGRHRVEQLRQVAVQHVGQLVSGEVHPVIGDAVLPEVVGADLLRAIAGADLAAAFLGDGVLLLLQLDLVEPRPQHLHRLRPVLDLRLLVLLRDHQAGRQVGDADRRIGGVDALAAGAARAEGVDAQVLGLDLHVDLLGLGQDRHRGGRGMDAAAGLGIGHALHAVDAALVLEPAVDPVALDADDHLADALSHLAQRHHLHLPALAFGEAAVHPEEIGGEVAGLLAAGAGADLEDDVLLVVRVLGQEQHLDLGEQRFSTGCQPGQLLGGQRRHLGVAAFGQLLGLGDLGADLAVVAVGQHQRLDLGQRLGLLAVLVGVALHRLGGHRRGDGLVALLHAGQLVEHHSTISPGRLPPETGGRKATSSPSATGAVMRA